VDVDAPEPSPVAVLLLQLGGPSSRAEVRPFIRRMLSDPAILAAPAFVRLPLAAWIAWRRAPMVIGEYNRIGGFSPIGPITAAQAAAVERALAAAGRPLPVGVAMRHAAPSTADAVGRAVAAGARRLVLVPLYPQYSHTTTGSAFAEVDQVLARLPVRVETVRVRDFADDPGYIAAVAATVETALDGLDEAGRRDPVILFSAHGLPIRNVERGDPYPERVAATVAAVTARLGHRAARFVTCFQSRVGPVRWLEPSTRDALRDAAAACATAVVQVPIAFVSDHLETLYEMDVEHRELARDLGIPAFARARSLNDDPAFAAALARLVLQVVDP
jgi:ferrochelatase